VELRTDCWGSISSNVEGMEEKEINSNVGESGR